MSHAGAPVKQAVFWILNPDIRLVGVETDAGRAAVGCEMAANKLLDRILNKFPAFSEHP